MASTEKLLVMIQVADIKRMNGLASDLQMFALKTLKIPLPGRHPPSSPPSQPDEDPAMLRYGYTHFIFVPPFSWCHNFKSFVTEAFAMSSYMLRSQEIFLE